MICGEAVPATLLLEVFAGGAPVCPAVMFPSCSTMRPMGQ